MLALRLIERKRDGGRIESGEFRALANAYATGHVPDYQMAAFLMACFLRGLDRGETHALTEAMLRSGQTLDLGDLGKPRIDKHSTGGVGDKVSIVLAPLVSSLGVVVPMMSGRGLGHTGGTLDKLESIPGFDTNLTLAQARAQLERLDCALIGQTSEIAPADKKMYALRDATGTVESIPLIAASIMSKKLAEGIDGLVLDVKAGSGAFLPDPDLARTLAETMIELGEARGCRTVALLTAMDRPLGRAAGNALEVEEAIEGLQGRGPDDLMELTYALGAEMLLVTGAAANRDDALRKLRHAIDSGAALDRFRAIIEAQGGNPAVVDDPAALPQAAVERVWEAPAAGIVSRIEPRRIGRAITALGGGRMKVGDEVDPAVGFVITARPGDMVSEGQPLATIYARTEAAAEEAARALSEAIVLGEPAVPLPLILSRITRDGVDAS